MLRSSDMDKLKSLIIGFIISMLGAPAFAGLAISSVTGASRIVKTGDYSYEIYGGYVKNATACTTINNVEPCNSCAGSFKACNENMIYDNLLLSINFTTDVENFSNRNVLHTISSTTTSGIETSKSGSTFLISMSWTTFLSTFLSRTGGLDDLLTSNGDIVTTIYFGVSKESSTSEYETDQKISLKFIVNAVDATSDPRYVECPSANCTTQTEKGVCYFTLFPGDEKLFVDDINLPCSFQPASLSTFKWTDVVFFYEISNGDDTAAKAAISNRSKYVTLPITDTGSDFEFDEAIKNLENGTRYCFAIGTKDNTGNIHSLMPNATITALPCAVPANVEGLLDGKKCFIATAAYGNPMHEYVDIFRQFRSKILLKSELGTDLTRLYYLHSPHWAAQIRSHAILRQFSQLVLWPFLVFAKVSLELGLAAALSGASALLLGAFLFFRGVVRYVRRRRERKR